MSIKKSSGYCWFWHDVSKIQSKKLSILPRFYFHDALEQLKTNFRFKRVLGFVIEYAWISKLSRNVAFTWRPRELSCRFKKMAYFRTFCYLNSSCISKSITVMFMSFSKNKFTLLSENLVTNVSVGFRSPCWSSSRWAPAWRLYTNLYKSGWNISSDISYTKYSSDLNLREGLCICTSFHFPDSGLYLLNGFDFYFDLFWVAWHWKPAISFSWLLFLLRHPQQLAIIPRRIEIQVTNKTSVYSKTV